METGEHHATDDDGRRWFPLTKTGRFLSPAEMYALPSDTKFVVADVEPSVHWTPDADMMRKDLLDYISNAGVVIAAPTGKPSRVLTTHSAFSFLQPKAYEEIEKRSLAHMAHKKELLEQDAYGTLYGKQARYFLMDEFWPDPEQPPADEEEINRDARRRQAKLNFKDRAADSRDAKVAMRDRALAKLAKRKGSQ